MEATRLHARNERNAEDRGDFRLRIQCIDLCDPVQPGDDYNATVEGNFTVALTNANEPPSISPDGAGSTASLSVAENQTAVTTVSGIDPDSEPLIFSISGGADQGSFKLLPPRASSVC